MGGRGAGWGGGGDAPVAEVLLRVIVWVAPDSVFGGLAAALDVQEQLEDLLEVDDAEPSELEATVSHEAADRLRLIRHDGPEQHKPRDLVARDHLWCVARDGDTELSQAAFVHVRVF